MVPDQVLTPPDALTPTARSKEPPLVPFHLPLTLSLLSLILLFQAPSVLIVFFQGRK